MATNNYAINQDDERLQAVQDDKQQAMTEMEQTYAGIIGNTDQYYQAQIDASKDWANTQSQLQQEQSDFAIEQIEQQKDQARKDYLKEQSGAYVDWQKQSNQYGAEAEKMADAGLYGTGYSESAQVSMYNTYQNRVATARESYNQAVMNYNNAIKDARLQNNSVLAEIAYQSLQTQLELSLQGFQYKNNLVLEQANKKVEMDNAYWSRYQDVISQINTENAMAEQIRQYNQDYAFQVKQYDESVRQFNKEYDLQFKQYNEGIRQFDLELERLKKKDEQENALEIKKLEQQKAALEQEQKNWEVEMQYKKDTLAEQKRQFDKQYTQNQAKLTGGGGGGGGSAKVTSSGKTSSTGKVTSDVGKVTTDYFSGQLPKGTKQDAQKFGTFANGYQPMGITGYGKVSKTGDTIPVNTTTLSGQKRTINQNIWKTPDGTQWYWEGRDMTYKKIVDVRSGSGYRQTNVAPKAIPNWD